MAYPTGTPASELIMQNVATTLAAIATPGYYNDVEAVVRLSQLSDVEQLKAQMPAILVTPPTLTLSDSRAAIVTATASFVVRGYLIAHTGQLAALEKLGADIRVALLTDWTRGGYALTTRVTSQELLVSAGEMSEPVSAVDLTVEIEFRHLYQDPNTTV